jgi:hypothetical protein
MGGAGGRGKGGSLFQKNDFSERFIKKGRFLFEWNSNGENTLIYLPVNSISRNLIMPFKNFKLEIESFKCHQHAAKVFPTEFFPIDNN